MSYGTILESARLKFWFNLLRVVETTCTDAIYLAEEVLALPVKSLVVILNDVKWKLVRHLTIFVSHALFCYVKKCWIEEVLCLGVWTCTYFGTWFELYTLVRHEF